MFFLELEKAGPSVNQSKGIYGSSPNLGHLELPLICPTQIISESQFKEAECLSAKTGIRLARLQFYVCLFSENNKPSPPHFAMGILKFCNLM